MRNLTLVCLTVLFLVSALLEPAEAGRRARRGRRTAVAAGVAGGTAAAAVVATSRPRTTVVAAAPVGQARATVVAPAMPDLTVAGISEVETLQCVVVQNIGTGAAAKSYMQVDVTQLGEQAPVSSLPVLVPALQPGQSVQVRLHAIPAGPVQVMVYVDVDDKIAEANEENNAFHTEIAPAAVTPTELPAVDVWLGPETLPTAHNSSPPPA